MSIRNELIDELLAGHDPASVLRQDGLLGELKKALLNRVMAAEFAHHLTEDRARNAGPNHRNGSTRKRVLSRFRLVNQRHLVENRDRDRFSGECHGGEFPDFGVCGAACFLANAGRFA